MTKRKCPDDLADIDALIKQYESDQRKALVSGKELQAAVRATTCGVFTLECNGIQTWFKTDAERAKFRNESMTVHQDKIYEKQVASCDVSFKRDCCTTTEGFKQLHEFHLESPRDVCAMFEDGGIAGRMNILDSLDRCEARQNTVCWVEYSCDKWDRSFKIPFETLKMREEFELAIIEEFERPEEYGLLAKIRRIVKISTGVCQEDALTEREQYYLSGQTTDPINNMRQTILFYIRSVLSLFDHCPVNKTDKEIN